MLWQNKPPPNGRFIIIIGFTTVHHISAYISRNTSEEKYQKNKRTICSTIGGISCLILSWQTGGHRPTSDLPIHPSTTLHQIFQLFQNPCSWRGMKSVEQIICMHLLDRIIPRHVGEINEIPPAAKQLFVLVARISDLLPKTHKFVLANGKKCNPPGWASMKP